MANYPGILQLMMRYRVPKTLIWVANLFVLFLAIFTAYRFVTFLAFKNRFYPDGISFREVLPSFLMGIRYDLRWISFVLLPVVLLSMVPKLSPFYSARNKKSWTLYLAVATFIVFFFFAAGFGSLSYNQTPLDAGAMNFVEDLSISVKMMSQTYPLFWMVLGLVVAVLFFQWMYHRSHWQVINGTDGKGILYRRKHFFIATLVMLFFIWGNLSWPPLGRNDSFRFHNAFKSYLAINPLQNFFATLRLRKPVANEIKARQAFPIMAKWMPLEDPDHFNYTRNIPPRSGSIETRPNIVLVQCESFSMYKSSMSGNPLNATPYFNDMAKQGIFFEKCFTPHFSTARGIFAILTGIPDAQLFKFSSRNPEAVNQHTIVNSLEEYSKHYFLGGDPEFGNFEGLLKNIQGLQMHTSGSFSEPEINVWGISDKDLFLEANQVFKKETKPFFAYIQTSGNHRPYDKSISPRDTNFHKITVPEDQLVKYGFGSQDEYNAFRYFDYCIQEFITAARGEDYFNNTIFVFVGDHGVAGNAEAIYPPVWTSARLTDEHVPLLFYAPQLLSAEWRKEVVSQVDVLPTIAGLVHIAYKNTTLGRDLLDPNKKNNFAFITNTAGGIGMVTDDYYFSRNINFPDEEIYPLHANTFSSDQLAAAKKELSSFTTAYFETARYLILNNRK